MPVPNSVPTPNHVPTPNSPPSLGNPPTGDQSRQFKSVKGLLITSSGTYNVNGLLQGSKTSIPMQEATVALASSTASGNSPPPVQSNQQPVSVVGKLMASDGKAYEISGILHGSMAAVQMGTSKPTEQPQTPVSTPPQPPSTAPTPATTETPANGRGPHYKGW